MIETKLVKLKNCKALIIDDDILLVNDLKTVLEFFFDKVLIATNGNDAIKLFHSEAIDVIFTDYVLPGKNGYEICKEIRQIHSDIPLIVLSSHSDSEKLLNLIDLKLTAYIIKPYNFEDILTALKRVVLSINENNFIYLNEVSYYDSRLKQLFHLDKHVKLTKNEISLLEFFIKNANQVIHQETLDFVINPEKPLSYQASKNIIYRLRKKIGKNTIENIQSIGYTFNLKS